VAKDWDKGWQSWRGSITQKKFDWKNSSLIFKANLASYQTCLEGWMDSHCVNGIIWFVDSQRLSKRTCFYYFICEVIASYHVYNMPHG
jgi:hypothetical protein